MNFLGRIDAEVHVAASSETRNPVSERPGHVTSVRDAQVQERRTRELQATRGSASRHAARGRGNTPPRRKMITQTIASPCIARRMLFHWVDFAPKLVSAASAARCGSVSGETLMNPIPPCRDRLDQSRASPEPDGSAGPWSYAPGYGEWGFRPERSSVTVQFQSLLSRLTSCRPTPCSFDHSSILPFRCSTRL